MSRFDRLTELPPTPKYRNRPRPRVYPGQQMGNLTVVDVNGTDQYGDPTWECRCVCGKVVTIRNQDLLWRRRQSCGKSHRRAKKAKR